MVQAKISDDQIEVILRRRNAGESWNDLAEEYGMSSGESLRISVGRRKKKAAPAKPQPAPRPRAPKPIPAGMKVGVSNENLLRMIEELQGKVADLEADLRKITERSRPRSGNQYKGAPRRLQVLGVLSRTEYKNYDQIIEAVEKADGERLTGNMVRNVITTAEGVVKITRRERRGSRNVPVTYVRLEETS